jgi:hypothetical protein
MEEEWKKCFFDDRYYVSNMGNVKRVKCNGEEVIVKGSILNKNRTHLYKYIQIHKGGKRNNYLFHRLVAIAFLDNEDNLPYVDHIDRDTFNNKLDNLRWCTQETNMRNSCVYRDDLEGTYRERKNKMARESYEKHKDKILAKYECECGDIVSNCNKWAHWKSKKHLQYEESRKR